MEFFFHSSGDLITNSSSEVFLMGQSWNLDYLREHCKPVLPENSIVVHDTLESFTEFLRYNHWYLSSSDFLFLIRVIDPEIDEAAIRKLHQKHNVLVSLSNYTDKSECVWAEFLDELTAFGLDKKIKTNPVLEVLTGDNSEDFKPKSGIPADSYERKEAEKYFGPDVLFIHQG